MLFHLISCYPLGIKEVLHDNKTEHLRQINALYRFNIYQEVLLASFYRLFNLKVSVIIYYMSIDFSFVKFVRIWLCDLWFLWIFPNSEMDPADLFLCWFCIYFKWSIFILHLSNHLDFKWIMASRIIKQLFLHSELVRLKLDLGIDVYMYTLYKYISCSIMIRQSILTQGRCNQSLLCYTTSRALFHSFYLFSSINHNYSSKKV